MPSSKYESSFMTNSYQQQMPTMALSSIVSATRTVSYLSLAVLKRILLGSILAIICFYANAQQTLSLSDNGLRTGGDTLKSVRMNGAERGLQSGDLFEYFTVQPANVCGVKGIAGGLRKETGPLVLTEADIPAQYPGGEKAWYQWIANHQLPKEISDEGGVLVTFVVDAEGNIGEVSILNSVTATAGLEAKRLLGNSGKWLPAVHQNTTVSFRMYMLIAW